MPCGCKLAQTLTALSAVPIDIDGIKVCSDSEGGVTKRSYNYRVCTLCLLTLEGYFLFIACWIGCHDQRPG